MTNKCVCGREMTNRDLAKSAFFQIKSVIDLFEKLQLDYARNNVEISLPEKIEVNGSVFFTEDFIEDEN